MKKPQQLLIEILETFMFQVLKQGSLSKDSDYPDSFFTWWNYDSDSKTFYSNKSYKECYLFQICFYSCNPLNKDWFVEDVMLLVISKLKENGFIINGEGFDIPSDKKSHTGRKIIALFEKKEEIR